MGAGIIIIFQIFIFKFLAGIESVMLCLQNRSLYPQIIIVTLECAKSKMVQNSGVSHPLSSTAVVESLIQPFGRFRRVARVIITPLHPTPRRTTWASQDCAFLRVKIRKILSNVLGGIRSIY